MSRAAWDAAAAATRPSMVIKLGGRVGRDPRLAHALARRWHGARRGALCIVHGGGDDVSALQRALGIEPRFVGGRRVTGAADVEVLRMALSGAANKRLVALLWAAGVPAVGLSGEDAGLLSADRVPDERLGAVGVVRRVDVRLLATLASAGYLPVLSPLAADAAASGAAAALNVNGDDAAAAVAIAVGADELLFVTDVDAVRVGAQAVVELSDRDAARGIAAGEITGGMEAKVRAALVAIGGGVRSVRIGGVEVLSELGAGTLVTRVAARSAPPPAIRCSEPAA